MSRSVYNLRRRLGSIVCIFLFASCGRYPQDVEKALSVAGDNKENLIAVLEHYRGSDAPKYKAACFLIANMPYHESNTSINTPSVYSDYFEMVDSICQIYTDTSSNDSIRQMMAHKYALLPMPEQEPGKKDIEILPKDFLILNIDAAFKEWHQSPLLKKLNFDEFKELILPYRGANETLADSKSDLRKMMYDKLSRNGMNNIRKPIELYKKYVRQQQNMNKRIKTHIHIGTYDLFIPAFKMDCHNLTAITCNIFRACGIPVVYEFTTQWTDKDTRHYWCSSPDSAFTFHPYTPPYNNLGEDWDLNLKYAGKVYRMTFEAHKNTPYFLKAEGENTPKVFQQPTMIDVTPNYHICTEVVLPAPAVQENKLAYLSFFNTRGLNPVAWGCIDSKKHIVRYQNVPINMLFFPTYISDDGDMIEFDSPFVIRQDSVTGRFHKESISCNHKKKVFLHLLRKYPPKPYLVSYREKIKGSILLASNQEDGGYDTLFTLTQPPVPYWQRYEIDNNKRYRYYKLQTEDGSPINIAEYEFLAENDGLHHYSKPSLLPVKDSPHRYNSVADLYVKMEGTPMKSGPLCFQACDGNLDTYIESPWVGMKFTVPLCVKALQLYPRNARNVIEPDNNYQLLYYDTGEWIEYATVRSTYHYLDFDSVPGGTIYWLRNLDQGKEELPFFFDKGRQVFIQQNR